MPTWDELQGIVRHSLTTVGGGLVTSGYLSSDDLSAGVGAVVVLLGIAWSILSKRWAKS
jgi:hypothetical protein